MTTELNGLGYIFPKLMKLERTIKYWNNIDSDEVINIVIFKDDIVIKTYKNSQVIEKSLKIKK